MLNNKIEDYVNIEVYILALLLIISSVMYDDIININDVIDIINEKEDKIFSKSLIFDIMVSIIKCNDQYLFIPDKC